MAQAQVSYTGSRPLVIRYPVTGGLESLRLFSDVRERLIVDCFTNNGHAALYKMIQAQVSHKMSGGSESPMFP